jgi:hypothetical protein
LPVTMFLLPISRDISASPLLPSSQSPCTYRWASLPHPRLG